MNLVSMVFFREYGQQLRTSKNRMPHPYMVADEKKSSTDIQRVGAVLRHDIPIKSCDLLRCRATILAVEQLSCL